jgi:molybdopterin-guanine dinucleotide biosynthesis protein A
MGRDKALLPFGGFETMVEYQHNRLSEIFDEVYISWKSEKASFGAESIFDLDEFDGVSAPTVGLISILEELNSDYVFIISVDSPKFSKDAIHKLAEYIDGGFDVISPDSGEGLEPLLSIYSRSMLAKLRNMVSNGEHKLNWLIKKSNTKVVKFNDKNEFLNLNYWNDYQEFI